MKKRTMVWMALFLVLTAGSAWAGNTAGAVSVSPHAGFYVFEGNEDLDDGPVYGVAAGYNFTDHCTGELVFDYIDTESDRPGGNSVDGYIYRFDGLYHFMPDGPLVPFVALGIGGITLDDNPGDDDTSFLFNYGGGLKYFLTDTIALRGDVRHLLSFGDMDNNLAATLGVTFLFGQKAKPEPPPRDSDNDGVIDDLDKCPGTPAGVTVDAHGCPLDSDADGVYDYIDECENTPKGAAVDAKGCPLDSDGDGVYDHVDQCPNTPKGAPVDRDGCPQDSDGDGVYDYLDRCANTPEGASVDAGGCPLDTDGDGVYDYLDKCPYTPDGTAVDAIGCPLPVEEKVSIELKIQFDFDKADIKSIYEIDFKRVASFMKAYPETTATIEGHTDSKGAEDYNMRLSQRRADNARQYLVDNFGIAPERLTAQGYGEAKPIADNATDAGRSKNRRVVAVISTVVVKKP